MKALIAIAILFISTTAYGQSKDYPYSYQVGIPQPAPHYFFETRELNEKSDSFQQVTLKLLYTGRRILVKPEQDFVECTIIPYNTHDTIHVKNTTHSTTDVKFPAGPFEIYTSSRGFNDLPISYIGSLPGKRMILTIVLGDKGEFSRPIIKSKRPLTDDEIEQMTDQAIKQRRDLNLIKAGTCYWTYEI